MASKALIAVRIEARRHIVPLTAAEVITANDMTAEHFTHVHENYPNRTDGTCYDWRESGMCKMWKTRPGEFRWPIKYGLRTSSSITHINVSDFHRADTCPVDKVSLVADGAGE